MLADPAGAVFGVSRPGDHRGAQIVNEPGAWAMSALTTPDPDGAKAFYGSVFGWQADTFAMGDLEVMLWRLPGFVGGEPEQPVPRDLVATGFPGAEAGWSVDFWVDDIDATAKAAAKLGGAVLDGPLDLPIGRQATLADPQGATFSVTTDRQAMSKTRLSTNNLTLDGVMQSPAEPRRGPPRRLRARRLGGALRRLGHGQEDGRGDSTGGAMLFGRLTYERWPPPGLTCRTTTPFRRSSTGTGEDVASTTLQDPLSWRNSALLEGDTAEAVARLKQRSMATS